MSSIVEHTYPQVRWKGRTKKLWNPIHKKTLKNLPEERIRLRVIEYLVQAGWSRNRISTEEAIGEIGDTSMRTDIICYNRQFDPQLLVECKAEHIAISAKTAEQVARYNQKVGAPHLLMTNGVSDYWYKIEKGTHKVIEKKEAPDFLDREREIPIYNFEYWKSRGFAGEKASPGLRKWFDNILPTFWFPDDQGSVRFLDFGKGPTDVDLSHYYVVVPVAGNRRLALTTINTAFGGNRMVIILNEDDENKAVLELNLDLLFDDKEGNSSLYSRSGIRTFDLRKYWKLREMEDLKSVAEQSDDLFLEYVE